MILTGCATCKGSGAEAECLAGPAVELIRDIARKPDVASILRFTAERNDIGFIGGEGGIEVFVGLEPLN